MTAPEVSQHIDADTFHVTVDLKAALLEHLPAVLRSLAGREDELLIFLRSGSHPGGHARKMLALADVHAAVEANLPVLDLALPPGDAVALADDLRDAATEPDLCPRAGCERYQVSCDRHGTAEYVAEPDRDGLSWLDVADGVGRRGA